MMKNAAKGQHFNFLQEFPVALEAALFSTKAQPAAQLSLMTSFFLASRNRARLARVRLRGFLNVPFLVTQLRVLTLQRLT